MFSVPWVDQVFLFLLYEIGSVLYIASYTSKQQPVTASKHNYGVNTTRVIQKKVTKGKYIPYS